MRSDVEAIFIMALKPLREFIKRQSGLKKGAMLYTQTLRPVHGDQTGLQIEKMAGFY